MEERDYAGRGTTGLAATGTALGGAALAGVLSGGNGLLGGLFNGGNERFISRYEQEQQNKITEKDMEIAYLRGRDASKTDTLETYAYINGELKSIREKLAAQDIKNAQIEGAFAVLGEQIKAQKNEFLCALNRERDERCCGDNSIINYANATFYPKMVADVTTGTTTTAQITYNPLPNCGCNCGCGR
jgi:hypothetical protein